MPATMRCPACQRVLSVPSKKLGQPVNCPACKAGFTADVALSDSTQALHHSQPCGSAFHCPTCRKPNDISGCAPGHSFLCFHCRQPFSIPGAAAPSADSGKVPAPPLHVAAPKDATHPTKPTNESGEFLARMVLISLAMLIVWGVLSALGIKANIDRVKWITGVAILTLLLAVWAIHGIMKLADVIRSPAVVSRGVMPAPCQPEGVKPSALAATSQAAATISATGITPLDHDRESARWWLARAGQVSGPYATAVVLADARTGRFCPDVQICQVGGERWLSIAVWLKERAANGAV